MTLKVGALSGEQSEDVSQNKQMGAEEAAQRRGGHPPPSPPVVLSSVLSTHTGGGGEGGNGSVTPAADDLPHLASMGTALRPTYLLTETHT